SAAHAGGPTHPTSPSAALPNYCCFAHAAIDPSVAARTLSESGGCAPSLASPPGEILASASRISLHDLDLHRRHECRPTSLASPSSTMIRTRTSPSSIRELRPPNFGP